MSINTGVMKCEILKPWDAIHIRENATDLEGLTGTELKATLSTRKYNLQSDRHNDHICMEEPKKNPTLISI